MNCLICQGLLEKHQGELCHKKSGDSIMGSTCYDILSLIKKSYKVAA